MVECKNTCNALLDGSLFSKRKVWWVSVWYMEHGLMVLRKIKRTNQRTCHELPSSFTKPAGSLKIFLNPKLKVITKSKNHPTWCKS
jgi:hypothetical protein